jgi:hypothetical protein
MHHFQAISSKQKPRDEVFFFTFWFHFWLTTF